MDKTQKNLESMRHSCEHVLMQAVLELFPKVKLAVGPATKDGFYFDFDSNGEKISENDFPKIEKRMAQIVAQNLPFVRKEISLAQARQLFKDNPFKLEWLEEIEKKGGKTTVYYTGNRFFDLCRGPHVQSTGQIGAFKLLSIAGAYWRGEEKNQMLTRIYGTCFATKKELEKYLWQIEEAKKRDHKKLGKELDYYLIDDEVGSGLIIWKPNGAIIRMQMEQFIIKEQLKRGYQFVYSPHIGKKNLWVKSGHWDLYRDKMYSPMQIDTVEYMVKPMNCPMHMAIYRSQMHSYKELPLRIAENASVYRYEATGELSGMVRGRHFTQDDAHIFCTPDQVSEEFIAVMEYAFHFLHAFGIKDYYMQLSIRDPHNKNKYLGSDQIWEDAQAKIKTAVEKTGGRFTIKEGEAAFYGPKLDFMIKDALGREWQCGTIQIDFMLPERFDLNYLDHQGKKQRPVVIHRAIAGSLERFFAILVEHYAGAFPLWLSPIQVAILPISQKQQEFAQKVHQILTQAGLRVRLDDENKTIGYKIREATLQKIPYLVIIGDKEVQASKKSPYLAVRTREGKDLGQIEIYQFIKQLKSQIEKYF
jgi:threonyl-tRNA synthetase